MYSFVSNWFRVELLVSRLHEEDITFPREARELWADSTHVPGGNIQNSPTASQCNDLGNHW